MSRLTIQKKQIALLVERELRRCRRFDGGGRSSWLATFSEYLPLHTLGIGGGGGRWAEDARILAEEIRALELLLSQLFLELVDLRTAREREAKARTCRGRIVNIFGHVLVGVCIFRILAATVTLVFEQKRVDPVTRLIDLTNKTSSIVGMQGATAEPGQREFWSQFVSFILVGIIIVVSIRQVLLRLTQFFSVLSSYISTSSLVLLLAQLMGMYFLSSVLLMRMNLPEGYRCVLCALIILTCPDSASF